MMTEISNSFATTFYFKEIFSDYEDFEDFLNDFMPEIVAFESENRLMFKYIYNKYCNSNIAYDTIDSFCRHFAITYENVFYQYKFRWEKLKAVYDLTTDDLNVIQYGISNIALNDNTSIENALDNVVDFVSSQTSDKSRANKFSAFLSAIRDVGDNYIDDYLEKFKKHFLQIIPNKFYLYS